MEGRFLLFLLGCIPARAGIAYLAATFPNPIFGLVAAIVALTWLTKSFPSHGFFGGNAWWADLRPIHAMLYLMYAASTIATPEQAYLWLLLDVFVGLVAATLTYM